MMNLTLETPAPPDPRSIWHPTHLAAITVITATRRELGFTQESFAKKIKWPRTRYAKLESYSRQLVISEFVAISAGFEIDPGLLLARILRWATDGRGPLGRLILAP